MRKSVCFPSQNSLEKQEIRYKTRLLCSVNLSKPQNVFFISFQVQGEMFSASIYPSIHPSMHLIFSEQSKSSAQFSAILLSIFCLEKATDTKILIVFWSYKLVCPCERGAKLRQETHAWMCGSVGARLNGSGGTVLPKSSWEQRKVTRKIPSISKGTASLLRKQSSPFPHNLQFLTKPPCSKTPLYWLGFQNWMKLFGDWWLLVGS